MARRRGLVGDGDPDADETDAGLSYSSPRPRAGGAAPEASRGWSERNKECGLVSMDEARVFNSGKKKNRPIKSKYREYWDFLFLFLFFYFLCLLFKFIF